MIKSVNEQRERTFDAMRRDSATSAEQIDRIRSVAQFQAYNTMIADPAMKRRASRRADRQQCVYCCRFVDPSQISNDHVIASSWYPLDTLPNLTKWQVPACVRCNNQYSQQEQDLLVRLCFCLDRDHAAAKGVVQRALRGIDPSAAKSEKERRIREKLQKRYLRETVRFNQMPSDGILPSFSENYSKGSRFGILMPERILKRIAEKWTRGVHYATMETIIQKPATIDPLVAVASDAEFEAIASQGMTLRHPPGVSVQQVSVSEESERITIYKFAIWEQFAMHSVVTEVLPGC